jgi:hypothetical protein
VLEENKEAEEEQNTRRSDYMQEYVKIADKQKEKLEQRKRVSSTKNLRTLLIAMD